MLKICLLSVTAGKQEVHQVFKEKALLAQVLPEYLSDWTTTQAQLEGVNCIPNVEVKGYKMENDKLKLILSNGQIVSKNLSMNFNVL